jgi:hypothetical protein
MDTALWPMFTTEEIRTLNKYFFSIHIASIHTLCWSTCFITTDYHVIHVLKNHLILRYIWLMLSKDSLIFKCKTNAIPILMHQMRISSNEVSSVMLRLKMLEIRGKKYIWKLYRRRKIQNTVKLSQIHRRIEVWMRKIILGFETNLWNLLFCWQINSYSCFKASTEYLATGL